MKKILFVFGIAFLGVNFQAYSHGPAVKVKKTIKLQNQKIRHGVKSGQLTRGEVKQLKRQQKYLKRTVRRSAADGVITRGEKRRITKKTRKLNRNIARKKHNPINR